MTSAEKTNVKQLDDDDMELIGTLMAISVTAKRLAKQLMKLAGSEKLTKGEKESYETLRNQSGNVCSARPHDRHYGKLY